MVEINVKKNLKIPFVFNLKYRTQHFASFFIVPESISIKKTHFSIIEQFSLHQLGVVVCNRSLFIFK